jgi:hypothetical protein
MTAEKKVVLKVGKTAERMAGVTVEMSAVRLVAYLVWQMVELMVELSVDLMVDLTALCLAENSADMKVVLMVAH